VTQAVLCGAWYQLVPRYNSPNSYAVRRPGQIIQGPQSAAEIKQLSRQRKICFYFAY